MKLQIFMWVGPGKKKKCLSFGKDHLVVYNQEGQVLEVAG